MHTFEVNIRICQPEKMMSTETKPRWTSLRELTNPDVNRKRMHQLFCLLYDTFSNISYQAVLLKVFQSESVLLNNNPGGELLKLIPLFTVSSQKVTPSNVVN